MSDRCDPWRDVDGGPIPQQRRIEQVDVDKGLGALPSRLYRQGQILDRATTRLIVRFDDEATVVRIRPSPLVVALPVAPSSLFLPRMAPDLQ